MEAPPALPVSLAAATRVWARIGLLSFGGPAGQIALMHRELVDERRWIDDARFLHALNYCMLLPGPEATQLAIYVGWLRHGTLGGLIAGALFVLPGFVAILALSLLYVGFQGLPLVAAALFGLKVAVLAIVVDAVRRIGKRALTTRAALVVAAAAFVAIFAFHVPFPAIVVGAGLIGALGRRVAPRWFPAPADEPGPRVWPSPWRLVGVLAIGLILWAGPVVALALVVGHASVFTQEAILFSKAATVTFGGAYAVLAYIAQRAVETFHWLRPGEMLDGLGLAETTPGPLIMVVQFVGFVGAYRFPGGLDPWLAGVLGALITVWVTFVPCFLWIFAGAPYIEVLRGNRTLHAALSSITAAVVGVILNLTVWFALHTIVPGGTVDVGAAVLTALALVAVFRFEIGMGKLLAGAVVLGAAWRLLC